MHFTSVYIGFVLFFSYTVFHMLVLDFDDQFIVVIMHTCILCSSYLIIFEATNSSIPVRYFSWDNGIT